MSETPPQISRSLLQRSRLARVIVAVVVTVPLVVSALYMWIMWDPTKKVDRLPVAVVNADIAVGEADSRISAGEDVTNNLLETGALDFRPVERAQAMSGLAAGDYYFVLEIPEDFSSTLAGIGDTSVAPALITVTFNDNNNIKASSIGAAAMGKISAAVLEGVSATTVGTVLDGVGELGGGLQEAADGSVRLHAGTQQLSDGVDELTTGIVTQLAPGVQRATAGSQQLAAGAGELSEGLVTLQGGTDRLGSGADQVADGIEQLVGRVDIASLRSAIANLRSTVPPGSPAAQAVTPLDRNLATVDELLDGLSRLQSGSRQIATELNDPSAAYRSGVDRLVAGGRQLNTGSGELAQGMNELSSGTSELAAGATRLQDGTDQVDDGAQALADGLTEGAEQVPDLGDQAQQQSLAELVSTPVETETVNVARAQFAGPGGAPTFLIIGSALIAVVVLMCFRGARFVRGREQAPDRASLVRRALTAGGVSVVAVGVIAVAVWNLLSPTPDPASLGEVVVATVVATLMNVAVFAVLFTVLGYAAGALASLSWLMLQVFSYGGVWMVETVPAPFGWLHPISPMTYVRDSMIAAFNGAPGFWSSTLVVALIGVAAFMLLMFLTRTRGGGEDRDVADESVEFGGAENVPDPVR
ncbi:YhgE/Pip domain-containing protein [Gordonia sp. LSe1-13]|uniref:YhgE/Pip domain-containing protein n=1 Tax=Gordonia sesuvii TaxID=3116777 RepID=A0ABU7MJP0_9ACTN|nr:YhgE/Pip domain-containing protein [Gordonia sp. LSe1-13]